MRKTLLSVTALAALIGAGLASSANAAPARPEGATVQTVQYYAPVPVQYWEHERWREHEWRRHERWRRWHEWHRWHRW